MITDKIIYDVREALKQYSDDSEISDNYILHLFGIKRAKYLRQDLNNYQKTFDNSILQALCVDLEVVSANECSVTTECDTILRTTSPIPKPLELHTKVALLSVKPTNRIAIPFNFITKHRVPYIDGTRFKESLYAFLDSDGYIYVTAAEGNTFKLLDCLTITGVFEDPEDLQSFNNCCGCSDPLPCYDRATTDYPLQPHYIDLIKREIVQDLLQFLQIPEDKENDSNTQDIKTAT